MGWCWLIISSRINFDLFLFASLFKFVIKSSKKGKKLSPKDLGPLDLTKNLFVRIFRQSYRTGSEAISTGFFQGSSKCVEYNSAAKRLLKYQLTLWTTLLLFTDAVYGNPSLKLYS